MTQFTQATGPNRGADQPIGATSEMVLASTPGVAGKQFVWLWRERVDPEKAKVPNPEVIVLGVADLGEKDALLASDPEKFFIPTTTTATRPGSFDCRESMSRS